jgi:hypothetical protein
LVAKQDIYLNTDVIGHACALPSGPADRVWRSWADGPSIVALKHELGRSAAVIVGFGCGWFLICIVYKRVKTNMFILARSFLATYPILVQVMKAFASYILSSIEVHILSYIAPLWISIRPSTFWNEQ